MVEDAKNGGKQMAVEISGSLLLDPKVLDEPYAFYRELHEHAPVWEIPGTGIYAVSTFELLAEAASRVQDFSSNMTCLLYRDEGGLPSRFVFGDINGQALATADPPLVEPSDPLRLAMQPGRKQTR